MLDLSHASEVLQYKVDHLAKPGENQSQKIILEVFL